MRPGDRRVRSIVFGPFPCAVGVSLGPFPYALEFAGSFGCVRSIPVLPAVSRVRSCLFGPFQCTIGCVRSIPMGPGRLIVGCVRSISVCGAFGFVGSIHPRSGALRVRSGALPCALRVIWFVRVRLVHSHGPWGS